MDQSGFFPARHRHLHLSTTPNRATRVHPPPLSISYFPSVYIHSPRLSPHLPRALCRSPPFVYSPNPVNPRSAHPPSMAEETKAPEAPAAADVVVAEAAPPVAPEVVEEETKKTQEEVEEKKPEPEEATPADEATAAQSVTFKEESNIVADLVDSEKKALDELKELIQAALVNNEFTPPPPPPPPPVEEKTLAKEEEAKPEETPAPAAKEETKPVPEESAVEADASTPPPAVVAEEPTKIETAKEPVEAVEKDKAVVVDEDGAKTVEAIEETIVSVAAPAAKELAKEEPTSEAPAPEPAAPPEEVFIWGVPLIGDEKSDTVLVKFLRAREYKVKEALEMIKNAVIWRKQFGIDALLEEDLSLPEMNKVVFMHGIDREGHPVCYNVYGEFQSEELYEKTFGDPDKRHRFLKWRIQYLEKGIREYLDFTPGGICSMVQVTDLKNSPRLGKHRQVTKQAVTLLQDNYPEFIAKKVFINVPWWYLAFNRMMSSIFTQRTKSKMVFAGPSKSADTLFKYIAPEQVPVAYGGLSKENDSDFTTSDVVTEATIKPTSKLSIEIPTTEASHLVWELRVLGWEVSYGAEFVPSAEEGYTVIVQKSRKLVATDEPAIKTSFKIGEPGKVVLNIDNPTSKKKKLLYRYKLKSSTEST